MFSPAADLSASFLVPGQFVEIELDEQKSFFALASAPGESEAQLLVKAQGGLSDLLAALAPGSQVQMGPALGAGFPVAQCHGRDVHLFSMGSGLAPFRSLVRAIISGKLSSGPVTLWQAAFTRAHLPYADEYAEWHNAGISIEICLDKGPQEERVSLLEKLAARAPVLDDAVAFWVGSPAFGAAVKAAAMDLGLPESNYLSNY